MSKHFDGAIMGAMTIPASDPLLFRTELRPHRSNTLKSVHTLMWILAIIWVPVAGVFAVIGAWPVLPLMGGEVLLLYGLLRLNLRRGTEVETIAVTPRELCVERVSHWGRRSQWSFQPQWLQVMMDRPPHYESRLTLRSHGRSVVIGRFLTPHERLNVAETLELSLIHI